MPPEIAAEMGLGYGTGDIPAFAFWSLGISMLILLRRMDVETHISSAHPIKDRILRWCAIHRICLDDLRCARLALGWARLAFLAFPCWLVGSCGGAIASVLFDRNLSQPCKLHDMLVVTSGTMEVTLTPSSLAQRNRTKNCSGAGKHRAGSLRSVEFNPGPLNLGVLALSSSKLDSTSNTTRARARAQRCSCS